MITRILHIWTRIEALVIGALLLTALGLFLGGAMLRTFAPLHAIDWAEEVSLYCIIWATVIAGSSLLAEGRHIRTDVFLATLSDRTRNLIGWGVAVISIGFCAAMMVYGWRAYEFALLLDERSASTLRAPQGPLVFLPLPVGMALMLARAALMILNGERPFTGVGETGPGGN